MTDQQSKPPSSRWSPPAIFAAIGLAALTTIVGLTIQRTMAGFDQMAALNREVSELRILIEHRDGLLQGRIDEMARNLVRVQDIALEINRLSSQNAQDLRRIEGNLSDARP